MTRLEQQMEFIVEMDKLKMIQRQTYLADGSRREDDAEHSWHLALMCILLKEYAETEIDILKVMKMVLIHDIVEIEAGDTFAYDTEGQKTAHEREAKAAEHLFGLLPDDQGQELISLWQEFEEYETAEARFAHAMDNCQPVLLNHASGGKSWKEHGVHRHNIEHRNRKTRSGAPAIWDYMQSIIQENVDKKMIIDD